jgi:hypothetical protein
MNAPAIRYRQERGSTLVVTITVVATILVLLGSAVAYTQHISRVSDRSRKIAQAMEVADGHLEFLFTHWRNISRAPGLRFSMRQPATNFFFTSDYNPGPAPTPWTSPAPAPSPWPGVPPIIPRPSPSLFSNVPEYTVGQYRIQAVTPMIELKANEDATNETNNFTPATNPPAAYGPNEWQYSFFYLAAVDISIPAMTGNVTAKVRRVFEKKYDNPWSYAIFYHDNLEMHPTDTLTISGAVHTNKSLYVSNNLVTFTAPVAYAEEYVNGKAPGDPATRSISEPNFPEDMPPAQESPYLPFGWNLRLTNEDGSVNNDSYRELIERPVVEASSDPLVEVRYYYQAGIKILIDNNNNVQVRNASDAIVTGSSGGNDKRIYDLVMNALSTNRSMYDYREASTIRVADLDIEKIAIAVDGGTISNFNGVIYISDTSANPAATPNPVRRAIRLVNGWRLPAGRSNSANVSGLTVVSDNPVYIRGNYNVAQTNTQPPSNTNPTSSPVAGTYKRKQAAVIADAITVLSSGWSDSYNSGTNRPSRVANSTTINAALVGGIINSGGGNYSGGVENFIRLLEDWSNRNFVYYGSLVQLYQSAQANTPYSGAGNIFKSPLNSRYYWDPDFGRTATSSNPHQGSPPGRLQIAAYLQQQRWYMVY